MLSILIFMSFNSMFYGLVFFHLLSRAFFKSLLFIITGMIIINMMGFFMTSGFMSKEGMVNISSFKTFLLQILLVLFLMLTLLYSLRFLLSIMASTSLKFNIKNCSFQIMMIYGKLWLDNLFYMFSTEVMIKEFFMLMYLLFFNYISWRIWMFLM